MIEKPISSEVIIDSAKCLETAVDFVNNYINEKYSDRETREVNISKHSIERYIERVKHVQDTQEMKALYQANREQYTENLKEMVYNSIFIFSGKTKESNQHADFYMLSNKYGLIVRDAVLVTIYEFDFNLPEDIVKDVVLSLVGNIQKLDEKIEKEKEIKQEELSMIDFEIEQLKEDMKYHNNKIKVIKLEMDSFEIKKKAVLGASSDLKKERDVYVKQLFNKPE